MKASSRKLSVVLVSHNSSDVMRGCASSLVAQNFDMTSCAILVVDNHSTDETVPVLQEEYPEFKIISGELNQGFAVAANRGAREGSGEYLLFLNPDTVLEKGFLRSCCQVLDADASVGIAGPRLVSPDGKAQPSCWRAASWLTLLAEVFLPHRLGTRIVNVDPGTSMAVRGVSGACLFTRRDVFERVGGFDERFFMYYEDLDYCRRVEAEGYRIMHRHDLATVHTMASSSHKDLGAFFTTYHRSRLFFYRKHLSLPSLVGGVIRIGLSLRVASYSILGFVLPRFSELARVHRSALNSLPR